MVIKIFIKDMYDCFNKKNVFKVFFIIFGTFLFLTSCATFPKNAKVEPDAFITPRLEEFNPKSTNQKYNSEIFELGKSASNKKKILEWNVIIKDNEDQPVFTLTNKGELIPVIEWKGKNNSDAISNDGKYYAALTIGYPFGKSAIIKSSYFSIDTKPLSVNVKMSTDMFSPGLVGKKDDVTIIQGNATKQASWNGIIYNGSGTKVKNYTWLGEIPSTVVWDGREDSNKILPDGIYYYQVIANDKVGNFFESEKYDKANLNNFKNQVKIFTKDILVNIIADQESFNPESSNPKFNHQTFELKSNLASSIKILNWKAEIINSRGDTVFNFSGNGELKSILEWNGKLSSGTTAKDDDYYALLTANFNSGSSSIGKTKIFSIDTVIPTIAITLQSDVFSPNGDGNLDTMDMVQNGTNNAYWSEKITNSENKTVWDKTYNGLPLGKESWDGKDNEGNLQPNGMYKYTISGIDKAGNRAEAEASFELKNEFTSAFLTLDTNQFSSNIRSLKITTEVSEKYNIDSYKIEILDKSKNVIRTFQGTGAMPDFIEWHGLTDAKIQAPDGEYNARLGINYKFGNTVQAETKNFLLDNTPPAVSAYITPLVFSPDNDGINDQLFIDLKAKDITGIKNWSVAILTPAGNRNFMEFKGEGEPNGIITWDGVNSDNEEVDSAEDYPVTVRVENNVGTVYQKNFEPIHVDILVEKLGDDRYKIKISSILFKADSAELLDTQKNKDIINMLTSKLLKFSGYNITVEGYVNPFIPVKYVEEIGQKLSEERAKAIANLLDQHGISIKRMIIAGKGGENPVVFPNDKANLDENYLEKNRRVEFYLNK